jgi:pimeloyl-ACP methyl ester carboxylesterase
VDEERGTVDVDPAVIPEGFYAGCRPEATAVATGRWRPEPLAPLRTTLSLSPERYGLVPRAYISCRFDRVIPLQSQERMLRLTPCGVSLVMDAAHSPFLSHSKLLAGHLHSLA